MKQVKEFLRRYKRYCKNAMKSKLFKYGKYALIGGLALGALGLLGKVLGDKKDVKPAETQQTVVPPTPSKQQVAKKVVVKQQEAKSKDEAIEKQPNYRVVERYFEDRYATEPEKFHNLSKQERDAMIAAEIKKLGLWQNI